MQMLYNSDAYAVVQIELPAMEAALEPATEASTAPTIAPGLTVEPRTMYQRGGFEIIDKAARREVYIEGLLAQRFQQGAQALVEAGESDTERYDE